MKVRPDVLVADDPHRVGDAGLLRCSRSRPGCRCRAPGRPDRPRPAPPWPARRRCGGGSRRPTGRRSRCRGGRNRPSRRCRSAARSALEREEALDALGGGDHHLAGLDLADEVGADDVEGAGLRGEHPGRRRARPSISGRTPSGSRTPISFERVIATIEKAPSTRRSASFIRSGMVFWIERAIRWMMHSVSEPDWKIEPSLDQLLAQREGVGQVAVVGDGGSRPWRTRRRAAGRRGSGSRPWSRRSSSGRGRWRARRAASPSAWRR